MNKKVNLVLASILFGGVATVLPTLLKICGSIIFCVG